MLCLVSRHLVPDMLSYATFSVHKEKGTHRDVENCDRDKWATLMKWRRERDGSENERGKHERK